MTDTCPKTKCNGVYLQHAVQPPAGRRRRLGHVCGDAEGVALVTDDGAAPVAEAAPGPAEGEDRPRGAAVVDLGAPDDQVLLPVLCGDAGAAGHRARQAGGPGAEGGRHAKEEAEDTAEERRRRPARDRDVQAARNILWALVHQYYGAPRPQYLCRQ